MSRGGEVTIHYRRPPNRVQEFRQEVLLERDDVIVTLAREMRFDPAMRIGGDIVLEDGSSVVWFTFPDAWHDIGRFHRADGTFTGIYANVLTPVEIDGPDWYTIDLFLDVWLPRGAAPRILDEHELDEAVGREIVEPEVAERARAEARRLVAETDAGRWPPPVVAEWTLERALEEAP